MSEVVVVRCSACDVPLTGPLDLLPVTELRRVHDGSPSLPNGVVVVDPEALTSVISYPDGRTLPVVYAPAGALVCRPDDLIHGAMVVSGHANGCCGMDGLDGPNQSCGACGAVLGTAWTDCWTPHEVRLSPSAAHLVATERHT